MSSCTLFSLIFDGEVRRGDSRRAHAYTSQDGRETASFDCVESRRVRLVGWILQIVNFTSVHSTQLDGYSWAVLLQRTSTVAWISTIVPDRLTDASKLRSREKKLLLRGFGPISSEIRQPDARVPRPTFRPRRLEYRFSTNLCPHSAPICKNARRDTGFLCADSSQAEGIKISPTHEHPNLQFLAAAPPYFRSAEIFTER